MTTKNWRRKYTLDETYFDSVDNKKKAFILGFIAADGSIIDKPAYGYKVCLNLQERDVEILEFIQKELKMNKPLYFLKRVNSRCQNQLKLVAESRQLINKLAEYHIVPKKTFTFKFPQKLDKQFYKSFLLGYFCGDGYIGLAKQGSNKDGIRYGAGFNIVGNLDLLTNFANIILIETGVKSTIVKTKNNITHRLVIGGSKQIVKVCDWMFFDEPFYLKRKYQKLLDIKELLKTRHLNQWK